jgi:hypothetical protein
MLPDITDQEPPDYGYHRKHNEIEQGIVGICDFELCGLPVFEGHEFYLDNKKIFCCKWHMEEQKLWEDENG